MGGNEMADLTPEEISEGRKQLSGPKILFWVALILNAIGAVISIFGMIFWPQAGEWEAFGGATFGLISGIVWVVLYWIEINGINKGRPYAVIMGRVLLIIMMIFNFPIGTIAGAIVWKRFSNPAAQKYLNYG
jgi:hypothetical protein